MIPIVYRRIQKGSTSQSLTIRIANQISFVPQTSVSDATSGLVAKYWRNGTTYDVAITVVSLTNLSASYNSGGIKAITDGWYRFDVPNAAFARENGVDGVLITLSATGMVSGGIMVELTDANPYTLTPQSTPEKY